MSKLRVVIRERKGQLFEGEAYAVSSTNEIGPFDILYSHANFVAQIKDTLTVHVTETEKKEFKLVSGILSARSNLVEVFLGI